MSQQHDDAAHDDAARDDAARDDVPGVDGDVDPEEFVGTPPAGDRYPDEFLSNDQSAGAERKDES